MNPTEIIPVDAVLGESPLWDGRVGLLYWLDIHGQALGTLDVRSGTWSTVPTGERFGSLALTEDPGVLLAATTRSLALVAIGDATLDRHAELARPASERAGNRFNDGKVDRQGRFWVGTMDDAEQDRAGSFYRYGDGRLTWRWGDVGVPNSLAFSVDGSRMYAGDSWDRTIWAAEYDAGGGRPERWAEFAHVDEPGGPDGSTVDAEDHLWNAEWGNSRLTRYAPDGSIALVLEVPVTRPTCPAFGGDDLDLLFVTTARVGGRRTEHEGAILVYEAGVRGLAEQPVLVHERGETP